MTKKELLARLDELERRIRDLEARPVYVPVPYAPPPWQPLPWAPVAQFAPTAWPCPTGIAGALSAVAAGCAS